MQNNAGDNKPKKKKQDQAPDLTQYIGEALALLAGPLLAGAMGRPAIASNRWLANTSQNEEVPFAARVSQDFTPVQMKPVERPISFTPYEVSPLSPMQPRPIQITPVKPIQVTASPTADGRSKTMNEDFLRAMLLQSYLQ